MFNIYKRNYNINCLVHGNAKESLYEYYFNKTNGYYIRPNEAICFFSIKNENLFEANIHGGMFVYDKALSYYIKENNHHSIFKDFCLKMIKRYLNVRTEDFNLHLYKKYTNKYVYNHHIKDENKLKYV